MHKPITQVNQSTSGVDNASTMMPYQELKESLFEGLSKLWGTKELFDYTIKAGGESFPVHKVVLASVSDFFYAMLTNGMKESQQNYVELKGVNSQMLKLLLGFVYTGNLYITEDNVVELLNAASHLQIVTAVKACLAFMNENISLENCVEMLDISRLHSSDKDFSKLEDYVADNFDLLVESGNFLRLSYESLKGLLSREELLYGPEQEVFQSILRWVDYNPEERTKHKISLMQNIRFSLMTLVEVEESTHICPELTRDPVCNNHLKEAHNYLAKPTHQRVLCQTIQSQLRIKPALLAIQDETSGNEWFALGPKTGKWMKVKKNNIPGVLLAESVIVNDFLITCGGMVVTDESSEERVTGKCHIFDPRVYQWSQIASMAVQRQDFALLEHKGYLYAIAGSMLDEVSVTEQIERYSFETNQWEIFTDMYPAWKPSYCVSACIYNDCIYTCDGSPEDIVEDDSPNDMAYLDIRTRTWNFAPMKQDRKCGFPIWTHEGIIYAIENDYAVVNTPTISWYDPKSGESGKVFCPEVLSKAKIVDVNNRVYFIHGCMMDDQVNNMITDLCTEVLIEDKSVITYNSLDPFPDKEMTQYCVRLRLPWEQYFSDQKKQ